MLSFDVLIISPSIYCSDAISMCMQTLAIELYAKALLVVFET
jgi:hypothetical protein